MKRIISSIMAMVMCTSLVACNTQEKNDEKIEGKVENQVVEAFEGKEVVNAEYVKEHLKDITLVDARGEKAAKKESIKGAIPLDWQFIATCENGKPEEDNWGCIPSEDLLGERLGLKGVPMDKEVVLFASTNEGWGEDGRIAWELKAAGYKDVKLVDGGFKALKEAGLETQAIDVKNEKPTKVEISKIDRTTIINTKELKEHYKDYKVIDVRNDDEYKGATKYGEKNGGHLPGAINIEFKSLFNEDGFLKSNKELTNLFESKGIKKDDKVVTYCTAGIRSAYMQMIMEMLGYNHVQNYDESFYRWCATENLEK